MKKLFVYLLLISSLLLTNAYALRCGNHIMSTNDLQIKVLKYCGEPASKQVSFITVYRQFGASVVAYNVQVDTWTYNFGPTQLMQVLIFHDGILTDIITSERGF